METAVETSYCNNCKREIPAVNFIIHTTHCHRRMKHCGDCNNPVPIEDFEKHKKEFHTSVACVDCGDVVDNNFDLHPHKANKCPKRKISCQYCELELTADKLGEHENYCGSRTEICEDCGQLIMLQNRQTHLDNNHQHQLLTEENAHPRPSAYDDSIPGPSTLRTASDTSRKSRRNTSPVDGDLLGRRSASRYFGNSTWSDMSLSERVRRLSFGDLPDNIDTSPSASRAAVGNAMTEFHDDTPIPCEFCDVLVPASMLVLHETGCTNAPVDLSMATNVDTPPRQIDAVTASNDQTRVNTSQRIGNEIQNVWLDADDDLCNVSDEGGNDFDEGGNNNDGGNGVNDGAFDIDGMHYIPCEVCSNLYPMEELLDHQHSCLNSQIDQYNFLKTLADRNNTSSNQRGSPVNTLNASNSQSGNYNDDTFDRMEAAISGLLPSVRDNVESRPALEERRYNRNFETRRSRRGDAIDPRWFPGYRGSAARNADSGNSGVLSENIRSADDDGTRSFRRELQFNRDPYDQVDRQYSNGISGGRSSNGVSGRRSGRNIFNEVRSDSSDED